MAQSHDSSRTETAEEDVPQSKSAIPLELFFDLVFVYAITQVVSLILHDLQWSGVGEGIIVLAIIWLSWSNWTWATNLADLEPRLVRVVILASMIGIFVMAHAVPTVTSGSAAVFAWAYLYVRLLAAGVLIMDAVDSRTRAATRTYLPTSFISPLVLIVAAYTSDSPVVWWIGALVIEIIAALMSGRGHWAVDAGHFAERHGLILIIALGEAIIAVGVSLAEVEPGWELTRLVFAGLTGACALYWAYFDRLQGVWEAGLSHVSVAKRGPLARDVYTLGHFPLIAAVVLYAVALESAFHHPREALHDPVAAILMLALSLFLVGTAVVTWRAFRAVMWERLGAVAVLGGWLAATTSLQAARVVLGATIILVVAMAAEYARYHRRGII